MEPTISIITLGVQDLEKSVAFYRDGLNLPTKGIEDGDIAFFQLKGTWLALFPKEALAKDANVSSSGSGFGGITLDITLKQKRKLIKL